MPAPPVTEMAVVVEVATNENHTSLATEEVKPLHCEAGCDSVAPARVAFTDTQSAPTVTGIAPAHSSLAGPPPRWPFTQVIARGVDLSCTISGDAPLGCLVVCAEALRARRAKAAREYTCFIRLGVGSVPACFVQRRRR